MVCALLLESILAGLFKLPWFQHSRRLCYAYAEWQAGSTLQLQRLAHENIGAGSWSNTTGSVPVTRPKERLATFNINDSSHPRLERPSTELGKVDFNDQPVQGRASPRYSKLPNVEQI